MSSRLLVLLASLAVTAASHAVAQSPSKATAAPGNPSLAGAYMLVAIDGHSLPYAPNHPDRPANAPPMPDVLASTLLVRPDGSFIMAMAYRSTTAGVERFRATPFSGTTAPDGAGFLARWDGAGITPLSLAGDTLTMNNEGIRFAYRKVR